MSEFERCRPWIAAALKRSDTDLDADDVKRIVEDGEALFWPGEKAAVITEVTRNFHVWLAGGDLDEIRAMQESAEVCARMMGCDRMTVERARPGWARALRRLGYEPRVVLVKEL